MYNYRYFHDGGGALSFDHPTYVERNADNEIFDALSQGEFCFVLNARQMGKSSLRTRVIKQLESRGAICASIDLGTLNTEDQSQWCSSLISVLNRDFNILNPQQENNWFAENRNTPFNLVLLRFFEEILLEKLPYDRIIIFLDEIDVLVSKRFKEDFLRFIQICYNKRADNSIFDRIVFCLLGVVSPCELINVQKRFAFNIGRNIELTGLDYHRAEEPFAKGMFGKINSPKSAIKKIFEWTNGQPFLTQKLCQLAIENAKNKTIDIDHLVEFTCINDWELKSGSIKDHLQNISNCLLSMEDKKNSVSLLVLLGQIINGEIIKYNPYDSQHVQLKLSGIVKIELSNFQIFNHLYAKVFNDDWIQQQLDILPRTCLFKSDSPEISHSNSPSLFISILVKIFNRRKAIVIAAVILVFIDLLSLYLSYYLFSDYNSPWTKRFNREGKGLIIELIYGFFIISFIAFSFNNLFEKEINQILTDERNWWIRVWVAVLECSVMGFICFYTLYLGPRELAVNYPFLNSSQSWYWRYFVPYLCYLPYSITKFVILIIPFLLVAVYSFTTSMSKNNELLKKIYSFIELYSCDFEFDINNIDQEIKELFDDLSANFLKDFNRYFMLLLVMLLMFIFELTIAERTHTEATQIIGLLSISLFFASMLIIFSLGTFKYRKIFWKSYSFLSMVQGDSDEFQKVYNLTRLIRRGVLNIRKNKFFYFLIFFTALYFCYPLYISSRS